MSSFGNFFSAEKLKINQQFNTKSYSYGAAAAPPGTGEIGDVWFVAGHSTAQSNGVWIVLTGSTFTQIAQMNA